jgi:hypothetical protein
MYSTTRFKRLSARPEGVVDKKPTLTGASKAVLDKERDDDGRGSDYEAN